MLIDWVTVRYPLTPQLGSHLHEKIMANMNQTVHFSPAGEVIWQKGSVDWDSIRSDSMGLFWSMQGDGKQYYLVLGASPSSLDNQGLNVFGHLDVLAAAQTLIDFGGYALGAILPAARFWQCRRLDITMNYDMGSSAQVKQALRVLLGADSSRRKASSDSKGGDSVYWNLGSDRRMGKAYHKGPQLRYLLKKNKLQMPDNFTPQQFDEVLALADRLLRFELKLGSRWFRELEEDGLQWQNLKPKRLIQLHNEYFAEMLGDDSKPEELHMDSILERLEAVTTKGRAQSAYCTWMLIKEKGYAFAKEHVNPQSFRIHTMLLRKAGLTNADLTSAQIIPFVRKTIVLSDPVLSWDEIRSRKQA